MFFQKSLAVILKKEDCYKVHYVFPAREEQEMKLKSIVEDIVQSGILLEKNR